MGHAAILDLDVPAATPSFAKEGTNEHRPIADVEGGDGEVVRIGDIKDGLAGVKH
jgi:hypothetical protein